MDALLRILSNNWLSWLPHVRLKRDCQNPICCGKTDTCEVAAGGVGGGGAGGELEQRLDPNTADVPCLCDIDLVMILSVVIRWDQQEVPNNCVSTDWWAHKITKLKERLSQYVKL